MPSPDTAIILQFVVATLLPVAASVILTLLERRTRFAMLGYWPKQVLIGIVFGGIAIFGTEFGIVTHDATMNVRDAAPLVAGLYFGGPAGLIAGFIGGIERWFAALWGRGMFTRLACTLGTIIAGIYAAALRRYLFDGKRPIWSIALAIGGIAEVIHLLLVFLTNIDNASRALTVVLACTPPMITCNAISVALSGAATALANGEGLKRSTSFRDISQVIQASMLAIVSIGFVGSVGFIYVVQQSTTTTDTIERLSLALQDVVADVHDVSDANLLEITHMAAAAILTVDDPPSEEQLQALAKDLNVNDIYIIDERGIVVASTDSAVLGFDMASGDQSSEFLVLLPGGSSTTYVQDYRPLSFDKSRWRKLSGQSIEGGFIQVGYDASQFHDDISGRVRTAVANRHIDRDGLFVVFDEEGDLMATRDDAPITSAEAKDILSSTATVEPDTMFENSDGTPCFAMYQDVEGFRIVGLIPMDEATQSLRLAVLLTSFMEVLIFAALFTAIFLLIRNMVVYGVWKVNITLDQITSGDLEAEVDVRNSTEFSLLSDGINRTVAALRNANAAEMERIERDLATAKAIQKSALPSSFPPFPDIDAFDIYASMNAAREVGGDFYDFFLVDDRTLCFLIADVSGKGIPASLFMMTAKSELANYIRSGMDLAEAVHSANRDLCEGNDAGMFVTVWAATLDFVTGKLTYVNAGHNPPLLRHNGTWQWLRERGGIFLGTFEMARYRSSSITLVPGDEILLYTDGVNEAFSVDEEQYGDDRLEAFLTANASLHPHVLVDRLRSDLRHWAEGAEQSDDITMLCLEYGVPPEVTGSITVSATREGLDELLLGMHYELAQLQCPEQTQLQVDHVVDELFDNICDHGYRDAEEPGKVQLDFIYNANPSSLVISLTDWGVPFNPLFYDNDDKQAKDEVSGMGIALVMSIVDDIAYVRDDDRNVVAFKKSW